MRPFEVGQQIKMKKPHACGSNKWQIIRVGMDFRIKCLNCGALVLMPRKKFESMARGFIGESQCYGS